ncbi:MAG TPA: helix-turn-helix transcriptional regulator [Terriglobales bacterium]|nr:helix-turn-helix transcriptional regulator [Terriglobales bacterium]
MSSIAAASSNDHQPRREIDGEALRRRYGLSRAELRVALGIAQGQSPREIAAEQFVSVYTVRAHLRSIFGKTGVKRQSALARLVWQS